MRGRSGHAVQPGSVALHHQAYTNALLPAPPASFSTKASLRGAAKLLQPLLPCPFPPQTSFAPPGCQLHGALIDTVRHNRRSFVAVDPLCCTPVMSL